MRTTLTIDDRVLAAARARAQQKGISIGQAVSQLALIGYESEIEMADTEGFPMLSEVVGHVITVEMVDAALDEQ